MGRIPWDMPPEGRSTIAAVDYCLRLLLLLLALLFPGAGRTQMLDQSGVQVGEATNRVQVLGGRISAGSLQLYRVTGLKKGEMLYVSGGPHCRVRSSQLDHRL